MNKYLNLGPAFRASWDLLLSALALIGIRGGGKSNAAGVIVEEAIGIGVPCGIIDPTGGWWGIKSSIDGKHPGLPVYVFGGEHGDVPLDPGDGKAIADFLVDKRVPIVCDLSLMRKAERIRFVTDFCEQVYHRNRDPLLIVIDETAQFCPQSTRGITSPQISACIGAVDDLVSAGRKNGIGVIMIGQRPARINKDILDQAATLISFQLTGPRDRKAIDEWVKEQHGDDDARKDFMRDLTTLKVGEAFVWSPTLLDMFERKQFRLRKTFDSSRAPKIGERRITPKSFASVDLHKLTAELADSRKRAEENDPKKLRARIKQLESAKQIVVPAEVKLNPRHVEAIKKHAEQVKTQAEKVLAGFERIDRRFAEAITLIKEQIPPFESFQSAIRACVATLAEAKSYDQPPRPFKATVEPSINAEGSNAEPRKTKGMQNIVQSLARYPSGVATKRQLATLSGHSPKSSTYETYLSHARTGGYVVTGDGFVRLTDKGRAEYPARDLATSADVLGAWEGVLARGAARMLRVFVNAYPRELTKNELAERVGMSPTSSTTETYLSHLRSNKLIVKVVGNAYQANAEELML